MRIFDDLGLPLPKLATRGPDVQGPVCDIERLCRL